MEAAATGAGSLVRQRAIAVLRAFAGALALGIALLLAFEPDVQQAGAAELVERSGDARAFFLADFFFVVLYAIVTPLAIARFGAALPEPPAWWMRAAVVLLPLAGAVDATENVVLWSATGSVSEGAVDFAHALAVPKIVLFVAGAACAIAVVVRAVREVR